MEQDKLRSDKGSYLNGKGYKFLLAGHNGNK